MHKLIRALINKNITHNEKGSFISCALLDVLLEGSLYQDFIALIPSRRIGRILYVSFEDLPEPIVNYLGLRAYHKESKSELYDEPDDFALFRRDLEEAFTHFDRYKVEFIDTFIDDKTISRKAKLLSVVRMLILKLLEPKKLYYSYKTLREWDPKFELVDCSFKEFYCQLNWYKRVGATRGCITNQLLIK